MPPTEKKDPSAGSSGRVVLLILDGGSHARALALALAGRGDSVILWDPPAAPGAIPEPVLDLQLALERAGGISLYLAGDDLAGAAEAFGRIDEAVAEDAATARLIAAAAARLERRLRPARLIVLLNEKFAAAAPPGMRVSEARHVSGEETPATIARILGIIE